MEPAVSGAQVDHELHPSDIVPRIVNIVSSFNVACKVDPKHIAMKALNAEYNPKRFNAVIMRIRQPKTTALIFPSGKLIVTGAKSESDSTIACRKFARILQKLGYPVQVLELKVQNMVGMAEVPFCINLTMLSVVHHRFGKWEPEIFPAMLYKIIDPKITLLIFASGKLVILGAKRRSDVYTVFEKIYPVLVEFRRS